MLDDHEFALCLTHDVDRVYKTYQGLYYGVFERDLTQLRSVLSRENPYWQFDRIIDIEENLGVRSAFNFLVEKRLFDDKPPYEWLSPNNWMRYTGRYDVRSPDIAAVIARLDEGGWEIGLHGSYDSYWDKDRLRYEKSMIESVLGERVFGGRQHHLNLSIPETWQYHAAIGLRYDTTLGSNDSYGFQHGYGPRYPFDDEFVVFPMTIMDVTLPDVSANPDRVWRECEGILQEAREHDAVITINWHQRSFSEPDFPGLGSLYGRLIDRALEMGGWVGPPGDLYERIVGSPTGVREVRTDQ